MSTKVRSANESDPTIPSPRWRVFARGVLVCTTRNESEALEAMLVHKDGVLLSPGDYVIEALGVEGGAA